MSKSVMALLAVVVGLALPASGFDTASNTCGRITDVPVPTASFAGGSRPWLRGLHRLLERFSEGDGDLKAKESASFVLAIDVNTRPLPWEIDAERRGHMRLLTWRGRARQNDENMPALVLKAGESWCTSSLARPRGARLRFEAFSLERDRPATLRVASAEADLFRRELPFPRGFGESEPGDVALEQESGKVCFHAEGGAVAIGEARILAPEEPGLDPRPRFIVLTIIDALRGDVLRRTGGDASALVPNLEKLSRSGHDYENAVSPGCHTRAAVWPLLTGRDLMRIDPLRRRQTRPFETPLESIYARANVPITQIAESVGYHSIFLGNNPDFRRMPTSSRYSRWSRSDMGTSDIVGALPALFDRYGDERVMLVYYLLATHAHSDTPRRLVEALSCAELGDDAQCGCSYDARARHSDEAFGVLLEGLSAYGLEDEVLHIVTADHGELLGEGMKIANELSTFTVGVPRVAYESFDRGHGKSCHVVETHVPLIVAGKGITPARWSGAVSGLDIVPTLLPILGRAPLARLDGVPLPLSFPGASREGPFVSYGFCSDSLIVGNQQLIRWVQGCRLSEGGKPLDHESELWTALERVATERSAPARLRPWILQHEAWLEERLAAEDALVFATMNLDAARVIITVDEGRIVDYGPSGTIYGLDAIGASRLSQKGDRLEVAFSGYRGLYYVSTSPPRAPLRIRIDGEPDVVTFVGPLQLPMETGAGFVDPNRDPSFLVADETPAPRETSRAALRFWWRRFPSHLSDAR